MSGKVETYVGAKHFMGDNWCARCAACRVRFTAFAFTEAEARREGENAAEGHSCAGGVERSAGNVETVEESRPTVEPAAGHS